MQWLLDRFATAPDKVAFIHEGERSTYSEVLARIEGFEAILGRPGICAGDKVAILADFAPGVICLMLALARRGAIVIPLSRASVVEEDAALAISGCDWFVEFDASGRTATFRERKIAAEHPLVAQLAETGRPGLILFSSGSSGTPKAILHDFDRIADKFRVQRAATRAIPFLMIDHFGGMNTVLAITSSLGTVVTVADRSVSSVCEAIARERVELLPATPSFLTLMLASGLTRKLDLSSLKRITYGTEVMPQSTLDRLQATFPGVELQQTYGLSEVGVLRSQSRPDGSLWVRVGGEGFETQVRDGVLWIRSRYAMLGYLNAPSNFDADGWFNTQDQVETDGEWIPHPRARQRHHQRRRPEGLSGRGRGRDPGPRQRPRRRRGRRAAPDAGPDRRRQGVGAQPGVGRRPEAPHPRRLPRHPRALQGADQGRGHRRGVPHRPPEEDPPPAGARQLGTA